MIKNLFYKQAAWIIGVAIKRRWRFLQTKLRDYQLNKAVLFWKG